MSAEAPVLSSFDSCIRDEDGKFSWSLRPRDAGCEEHDYESKRQSTGMPHADSSPCSGFGKRLFETRGVQTVITLLSPIGSVNMKEFSHQHGGAGSKSHVPGQLS